jgi:acetylornithine deacetylase/succinyl-diaminopimelate desuccinylase-like protein
MGHNRRRCQPPPPSRAGIDRKDTDLTTRAHRLVPAAAATLAVLLASGPASTHAGVPKDHRQLAHDVFKQLIEINTTDSVGNNTVAAAAMMQVLLDGGFPQSDLTLIGPDDRKGNLVARYRGRRGSRLKPVLIIAHLDVVEARREDWTTDPFQFVEKDGFYYGRGTQDMKVNDAIIVANFVRLREEGYVPDRDIILALTSDEETGPANGVDWLLRNHRDLIDAEYAINPDAGGVTTEGGKPLSVEFEATEKLYADYQLLATGPGGHSSLPTADNPIYHVADALAKLERTPFPVEFNTVTRAYFAEMAKVSSPAVTADLKAILATPPDGAALQRLAADPRYNSTLRTTCVATLQSGGHAVNALPQRGEANVNCRIFPGHSQEEIRLALVRLFDDVTGALTRVASRLWPGVPVIPEMETGASDSIYTMAAGIPSYGISGIAVDRDDHREHGRDERVAVKSYYDGLEFYYEFLKDVTSGRH